MGDVVLQAKHLLPGQGELVAEGEIILSSVWIEFGGSCISQAAGSGFGGHCGATGSDEQPLASISNISAQALVLVLCIFQLLGVLLL